jgi:propanol-preferring alcohol dehydrogenase
MRAMVLESPRAAEQNPLALRDLPLPEPGPCQVRVRVAACGVCHTDLHVVEGELQLPKLPLVPGHQIAGVVDVLGAGARAFREGDRVGIPWLNWTCGECRFCRKGLENLCERARFTGFHTDGGYAEATVIDESFAYALPKSFPDLQAAPLLCAGIIGYRSLRLSGVKRGDRLGLYGFGASAHIVVQLARHLGCEVYVFTRSEEHRQLARELGAAWAGSAEDEAPEKVDGAIIFAPAGRLVPMALRATRKGGTVAMAGITMSPIPEMDYDSLLYHERVLRSVANSTREDARELLRLAAEIPVRTEVQSFKLEEANLALQSMKHSRIRGAAVLEI